MHYIDGAETFPQESKAVKPSVARDSTPGLSLAVWMYTTPERFEIRCLTPAEAVVDFPADVNLN